jgi:hypothetical protein
VLRHFTSMHSVAVRAPWEGACTGLRSSRNHESRVRKNSGPCVVRCGVAEPGGKPVAFGQVTRYNDNLLDKAFMALFRRKMEQFTGMCPLHSRSSCSFNTSVQRFVQDNHTLQCPAFCCAQFRIWHFMRTIRLSLCGLGLSILIYATVFASVCLPGRSTSLQGYEGFVDVSRKIMQGRTAVEQRAVVHNVLLSLLPPGAPAQVLELL